MPVEQRQTLVYNPAACTIPILGCTAPDAINYNPLANTSDGSCIWGSDELTVTATKNDCPAGQTPTSIQFTANANEYTSPISKAAANNSRDQDVIFIRAQQEANRLATCILPAPTEYGDVRILSSEYQRPSTFNGYSRPGILIVKLIRTSQNGISAINGELELRRNSINGAVVERLPNWSFAQDGNCTTARTTMGLPDGSYLPVITKVNQGGYTITNSTQLVRFADTFSTDIECPT